MPTIVLILIYVYFLFPSDACSTDASVSSQFLLLEIIAPIGFLLLNPLVKIWLFCEKDSEKYSEQSSNTFLDDGSSVSSFQSIQTNSTT